MGVEHYCWERWLSSFPLGCFEAVAGSLREVGRGSEGATEVGGCARAWVRRAM